MSQPSRFFDHQLAHFVALALLLAGLAAASRLPGFFEGETLGVGTATWVVLCVANAVLHQVYVWVCWRLELGSRALSRVFGVRAFALYAGVFAILILARPLLVTLLAISNAGTLAINANLALALSAALAAPLAWLGYSVHRYFGFARAVGLDHFDPSLRSAPFVREGIFAVTPNAMYVFGFLALWIPAIALRSTAAVAVALFCHAYIWVHYLCTERPDMEEIYGSGS